MDDAHHKLRKSEMRAEGVNIVSSLGVKEDQAGTLPMVKVNLGFKGGLMRKKEASQAEKTHQGGS